MSKQMFLNHYLKGALLIIVAAVNTTASAQTDSANQIRYTPEFRFKEGIFLNFEQVRQNNPVPKSSIITTVAYDDPDFFERVLNEKKIQVFDNLGSRQEVPVKNLWGFSRNGVLYININEGNYRITIIGNICHFVASLTTYYNSNHAYSPYYSYGYPYSGYYPYSPYYSPYASTPSSEMKQYLLDFKTGNVLEYNVASVELLLMTDPELHDEFAALSNKKQKQMKFLYIRKFNERNPLYFPNK